jgi:histone-lysine N-methyltransferase SETMAR
MTAKVREVILEDRRRAIHDVGKFYYEVLRRLRENVRHRRPEIWKNGYWLLHHDNALAHTSLVVREFLTKKITTSVSHPAYSPDLAPCDFCVFPKMKLG